MIRATPKGGRPGGFLASASKSVWGPESFRAPTGIFPAGGNRPIWKHPDYPRSSYWRECDRDPLEETFCAADRVDMAFLPECGVIHESFVESHADAKRRLHSGQLCRCGRIGLVPAAPVTADFLIAKYDALIEKFGHHPSFRAVCMPAENAVQMSYDNYTLAAWKKCFSTPLPSPAELAGDAALRRRADAFLEEARHGLCRFDRQVFERQKALCRCGSLLPRKSG